MKISKKSNSVYIQLKTLSIETWERIGFARTRKGLKIYETTITQNLLYSLLKFSESNNSFITMLEATNEKVNGNDIEICIATGKGFVLLPTQAKILYGSGKYDKINHKNQIENIIKYAKSIGGIPAHLFYNYDSVFGRSKYGCTMMKTEEILRDFPKRGSCTGSHEIKIPSFSDLHPKKALPWHEFIFDLVKKESLYSYGNEEQSEQNSIRRYSKDELLKQDGWKDFKLNEYKIEAFSNDNENIYTPRFRVIIEKIEINKQ